MLLRSALTCSLLLIGFLVCADLLAMEPEEVRSETVASTGIANKDAKICKRIKPTGSRIVKRYCLPKSEWDDMRSGGQRAAREAIRDSAQVTYGPD